MILKMKKLRISGDKSELKKIIEILKGTGAFEMAYIKKQKADYEPDDVGTGPQEKLAGLLARTKAMISFVQNSQTSFIYANKRNKNADVLAVKQEKALWNSLDAVSYSEFTEIGENESGIEKLLSELEQSSARLHEIKIQQTKNNELIHELKGFINLPVEFDSLADTHYTFTLCGIIPKVQFENFINDIDISQMAVSEYPVSGGKLCVVITGHKDDRDIAEMIYSYEFERCKFDFNQTASAKIQELGELDLALGIEYSKVLHGACLSAENIKVLKHYYDYLVNELNTYELLGHIVTTKTYYFLNGWIPEKDEDRIESLIRASFPNVDLKTEVPGELDKPPVIVKNSKLIAPYQSITNMYGSPSKKDIDPNPFVALFYFIFFGMMVGDIGYGLILFVATLAFLIWKKPKGGTKSLMMIFCMGSISVIIWGFLFGSFFGSTQDGPWAFMPNTMVVDPINDAILFLVVSLCCGVIHIMFGIALNMWNALRQGRILDALFDSLSRLIMFVGLIFFVGGMFLKGFAALKMPGLYIAVAGLGIMVVTNGRKKKSVMGKIIGGFSGLYSLVNYFSDILSYARLFGIALVGAVIGMVGNDLGRMLFGIGWIGYPLGILIAAFFHIFNLALGLLSTYVHNARLQFVEFFSKFYQGEGKDFEPIGPSLKYTRVYSKLSGGSPVDKRRK